MSDKRVGICGSQSPEWMGAPGIHVCDLPAGHDGWHSAEQPWVVDHLKAFPGGRVEWRDQDEKAELARLRSEVERLREERDQLDDLARERLDACLLGEANLSHAQSEVERLTRERDEARRRECSALCRDVEAERDSLSSKLNAMIQLCDQKAAERDAALEANDRLREQLEEAKAKLKEVEG